MVNQDSRFTVKNIWLLAKNFGKEKQTMGMSIKGAIADGVMLEYIWMAQLKGIGKAQGVDGQVVFTGNTMSEFDVVVWEWK